MMGTYSFSRKGTLKSLMLNVALCYMVTGMALPNIFMRLGLDSFYLSHLGIHDLNLNISSRKTVETVFLGCNKLLIPFT